MSRMIDRLRLAGVPLGGMQSVVIDNAAEYFLTTRMPIGWDRDTFTLADFPQCLSPWQSAFVEFRLPASEREQHREAPHSVGMAVYSTRKTILRQEEKTFRDLSRTSNRQSCERILTWSLNPSG